MSRGCLVETWNLTLFGRGSKGARPQAHTTLKNMAKDLTATSQHDKAAWLQKASSQTYSHDLPPSIQEGHPQLFLSYLYLVSGPESYS